MNQIISFKGKERVAVSYKKVAKISQFMKNSVTKILAYSIFRRSVRILEQE